MVSEYVMTNYLKNIKRYGYGYRSFRNLRSRALLVLLKRNQNLKNCFMNQVKKGKQAKLSYHYNHHYVMTNL